MCQGIIYKATNLINGKCYVGKTTTSLRQRKIEHFCDMRNRLNNIYFHNALKKYGIENFKWEVIFECDDELILNVMETFKIMVYHSHKSEGLGYNLTWGGEGVSGWKHTDETKETLRNYMISLGDDNPAKKYENRIKISNALKGHSCSDETKQKISCKMTNNNNAQKYSEDVIFNVFDLRRNGMSLGKIAKYMNIPKSTICNWFRKTS